MAGMSPTSTDSFPKMGDDGMASLVNMSGQRSPYTMPVSRKGPTSPDTGGSPAARKGSTMIHEANGPAFRPMMTRGWAPEYPDTGRAMRTMPSAMGNRDFWNARAQSYEGEAL